MWNESKQSGEDTRKIAEMCKCLGNPIRLKLLSNLVKNSHLEKEKISLDKHGLMPTEFGYHARRLTNCGLLHAERFKGKRFFSPNFKILETLHCKLDTLLKHEK